MKLYEDTIKQTRGYRWTRFCRKCNLEKDIKGGTFPDKKERLFVTGQVYKFICADCRGKENK